MNIKVNSIRHPKEKLYLAIMVLISIVFLPITIILLAIPVIIIRWILGLYFRAVIYGNAVRVTSNQYPEIYQIVRDHSKKLNLSFVPEVFVCSGEGWINSLAIKFFSKKYIILLSNMVDLMLGQERWNELSMVLGNQVGYHAAGHTSFWKTLLLWPAYLVPFLGAAYSRACVLTADRIGYLLTGDIAACQSALIALAHGSKTLLSKTNVEEFLLQEYSIPWIMGFLHKIYSTHPRITTRVIEVTRFHMKMQSSN